MALRRRIRTARRDRPKDHDAADAEALAAVVLELPEVQRASCLTLFASVAGEVGTAPLRTLLGQNGVRVLMPIVLPNGILEWAWDTGPETDVPSGGLGGPEPAGARLGVEAVRAAEVLLIPALAVDTLGRRLGHGAGYYDRALALAGPAVPVVALVHEDEVLDAAVEPVPVDSHDIPVHMVATPRRCLRVN